MIKKIFYYVFALFWVLLTVYFAYAAYFTQDNNRKRVFFILSLVAVANLAALVFKLFQAGVLWFLVPLSSLIGLASEILEYFYKSVISDPALPTPDLALYMFFVLIISCVFGFGYAYLEGIFDKG
jgi:hypothetical protein